MAGRFINTNTTPSIKQQMPNLLVNNAKKLLNNPYYLFNTASKSDSRYFNINTTMTTLDEADRGNYSEIGPASPIKYNQINNFCLFGVNRMEPNLEITDFGLEGSDITGDAIVLPNTIIPYPGDFFILTQLGDKYLFRVTAVNPNTLDTGAVLYKINYTLAYSDGVPDIYSQVVKVYNFIIDRYGSNFGCLIELSISEEIKEIERYLVMLKDYYSQLFYDNKIQSFAYLRNGLLKVYDPYLIEFMIRNKILDGATNYIHVSQQVVLPSTFGIDYDTTIFSAIEEKDINKHYCRCVGNLLLCTQRLSLLYAYPQDYYCMDYVKLNSKFHPIDIFEDHEFLQKIKNNVQTNNVLKNIIIGYFNDAMIDSTVLEQLKHVDFMKNQELYYLIPFTIFCMEQYIQSILGGV